jgi:hypothetical protein
LIDRAAFFRIRLAGLAVYVVFGSAALMLQRHVSEENDKGTIYAPIVDRIVGIWIPLVVFKQTHGFRVISIVSLASHPKGQATEP